MSQELTATAIIDSNRLVRPLLYGTGAGLLNKVSLHKAHGLKIDLMKTSGVTAGDSTNLAYAAVVSTFICMYVSSSSRILDQRKPHTSKAVLC